MRLFVSLLGFVLSTMDMLQPVDGDVQRSAWQINTESRTKVAFTHEEVSLHNSPDDLWGVIDGYVVDLTGFVKDHPGGLGNIMKITREKQFSFARGANAHFGVTAFAFEEACRDFESKGEPSGYEFTFQSSRKNGGLNDAGEATGQASGPVGTITFIGKLASS
mmetsp:Transcript_87414/g.168251  ORF Transcript_87414/g.168251 Transcript_87414/m.168251 type:complete len:163 (-) Transcript_87414:173-661(-)